MGLRSRCRSASSSTRRAVHVRAGRTVCTTHLPSSLRHHFVMRISLFLLILVASPVNAQPVDSSGAGVLIAQAMEHSEVMSNLRYLTDAIGPRLSGSPAMRKANEWVAKRFRDYGLRAWMEEYPFG